MNQLSSIVMDFVRYRRADGATRRLPPLTWAAGAPVCSLAAGGATSSRAPHLRLDYAGPARRHTMSTKASIARPVTRVALGRHGRRPFPP
jgi:hypothetical protein